ncbi:Pre-rRNA-processing protein fhl1 [Tulasnella sp. 330]|nr:Pre-rRNA-processing protein fhl1 [Tulasnella sp. 330]
MPDPSSPPAPIQAYYKLTFPNFEYYLQTLSVTIGRRPIDPPANLPLDAPQSTEHHEPVVVKPDGDQDILDSIVQSEEVALECLQSLASGIPIMSEEAPPASPHPSSSSSHPSRQSRRSFTSSAFPHIDVDLGPLKSISRLHARIDYDDSIDKFVLYVNGRNGAWVDGAWVGCGGRVALGARTQIQISTRTFYFELPPSVVPIPVTPDTTPEADIDPTSADDPPHPPSPSTHLQDFTNSAPSRKRRRLSHSVSRSPSPSATRRRKPPPPAAECPSTPLPHPASSSLPNETASQSPAESKLPTSATVPDDYSDEDLLVSINDLEQDDIDELEAMPPPSDYEVIYGDEDKAKGKGKGKGKGKLLKGLKGRNVGKTRKSKVSNNAASKTQVRVLKPPPKLLAQSSTSGSSSKPKLPALTSKKMAVEEPQDPTQPRQPKKYMTQRLIAKTQMQQAPRPPPDQMPPKPPYTYAVLCYRAINELGGKASLSEIVNWIRDKFEWYRWNDECGWESSVRHNLSSNPGFVKSRRDNEVEAIVQATGQQKKTKGFFWSIDPKAEESFAEKEREIAEAGRKMQQKARAGQPMSGVGVTPGMPIPPSVELSVMLKPVIVGGTGGSSGKHVMPVPMMAPRGMGAQPPPPPVGMMMNPGLHSHPHMAQPPMMSHPPLPMTAPAPPSAPAPVPPHTLTPSSNHPSLPAHPPLAFPPPPLPSSINQSAFPPALSDVCLSIIVGPLPPAALTDPSSPYAEGQPITLHNGSLILNPTIFAGLTTEQLDELQKLKAAKALEILTEYTKNFVKEQIVKKGKARGKVKTTTKTGKAGSTEPTRATGDAAELKIEVSPTPTLTAQSQSLDSASILAIANLASASAGPSFRPTPSVPSVPTPSAPYPGGSTHPMPLPYGYYGAYPFAYSGAWAHPGLHQPQSGVHFPQPWMQMPPGPPQPPHYLSYPTATQVSQAPVACASASSAAIIPNITAADGLLGKKIKLDDGAVDAAEAATIDVV